MEKELSQQDLIVLNNYRHIFYTYPYGSPADNDFPRLDQLTTKDEKLLAEMYSRWRNEPVPVNCQSCLNEVFSRLMEQMLKQEKKRLEFGITEVDKLRAELRTRVKNKLEREN